MESFLESCTLQEVADDWFRAQSSLESRTSEEVVDESDDWFRATSVITDECAHLGDFGFLMK